MKADVASVKWALAHSILQKHRELAGELGSSRCAPADERLDRKSHSTPTPLALLSHRRIVSLGRRRVRALPPFRAHLGRDFARINYRSPLSRCNGSASAERFAIASLHRAAIRILPPRYRAGLRS